MQAYSVKLFLLLIVGTVFLLSVSAPPTAECVGEEDNPACQQPFYADDQDEYFYDIRASWILNQGLDI